MLKTLVLIFLKIGLLSIGGGYAVIPLIREQVVEKLNWITPQAFTDMIAISQMTPGPLAVNISTFVGIRLAGIPGAVAATVGCVLCGIGISLFLQWFFGKHRRSVYIFKVLNGLKAASLGLIASAAGSILLLTLFGVSGLVALNLRESPFDAPAFFLMAASLYAIRRWKINPVLIMLLTGAAGGLLCLL